MGRAAIWAGSLIVAAGAVWTLQGVGWLRGSFMTGSSKWLVIGLACLGVGASLLLAGLTLRRRNR